MVLRFEAEEVAMYPTDLDGDAKRALLSTLTSSLDAVLPFLTAALEAHYGASLNTKQRGVAAATAQHGVAVSAALGNPPVWLLTRTLHFCRGLQQESAGMWTLDCRSGHLRRLRRQPRSAAGAGEAYHW